MRLFDRQRLTSPGFTLIEILVATTIIIVLSTIAMVSFRQTGVNARNSKRKADLETVRQALVLYRTDQGTYPVTTSFATMLSTIDDYLTNTTVADPQNTGTYVYSYTSAAPGSTFTVCGYLEPDPGTQYCLDNP